MIKLNDTANIRKLLAVPYEQLDVNPITLGDIATFVYPLNRLLEHCQSQGASGAGGTDITVNIGVPAGSCWRIINVTFMTDLAIPTRVDFYVKASATSPTLHCIGSLTTPAAANHQVPIYADIVLRDGWYISCVTVGVVAATNIALRVLYTPIRAE